MSKIPIPNELHKRSELGIQKAKEEMGDIKKEYKNKKKILLVASILLPFVLSGSLILNNLEFNFNKENTKSAGSSPKFGLSASSSLPNNAIGRENQLIRKGPIDYMRIASLIFSGTVTEITPFQVQGETLTKVRVNVEETYRGSTKKGERVTFLKVGQDLGNPVITTGEKYLFFGLKASDEKEVDEDYYCPLKIFQGQEAQKVLEQVNK